MNVNKGNRFSYRILILVLCFLGLFSFNVCKPEKKVFRVGILNGLDYLMPHTEGFLQGMTDLGYIEGENITYDIQKSNFDIENYKKIVQQFIDDKVDLIYVHPTQAAMTAKEVAQGSKIPVLFNISNIEDTGLINTIADPGEDITGVRYPGPDIAVKRYEILRTLAPEAMRILIPYLKTSPIVKSQLELLYSEAGKEGVTILEAPVDAPPEVKTKLEEGEKSEDGINFDAILVIAEPVAVNQVAYDILTEFAVKHRIPFGGSIMAPDEDKGSIFTVNIDIFKVGIQAAPLAEKILKGTPAGDIPVISADNYFEINTKAAKVLGVTVPEGMLEMANKVYK